ncbi:hypothetical protein [Flavobacterium sp.]|uniref:hypothetical protein n=1 Tax=Flavobacterium sp. TaxID=239 RepID=UPI001207D408|nr:hypothetical protein [Flavobacterium sp.]RZJ71713.1 MAG: hypothetical protein EOO49_08595 [Flavobacterium sp.]
MTPLQYALDIYAKILVATFGFIAPSVTLLFPVMIPKLDILKANLAEKSNTLKDIEEMYSDLSAQTYQIENGLTEISRKLREEIDRLNEQLDLLSLKKQVPDIFGSLLGALVLIIVGNFVRPDFAIHFDIDLKVFDPVGFCCTLLIGFSFLLAGKALFRLYSILCLVVDFKFEEQKKANETRVST